MEFLKVTTDEFLNEIQIVNIVQQEEKVWNSFLFNKYLRGVAEKQVSIFNTYLNFNFRGAAYCFHNRYYYFERHWTTESMLYMGYVHIGKGEGKIPFKKLRKITTCPLNGKKYHPMNEVHRVKMEPIYSYKMEEPKLGEYYNNAFITKSPFSDSYTFDDSLFEKILNERGFSLL